MKIAVLLYACLAGALASSIVDFILCALPLFPLIMRPRLVDVFIFNEDQQALAELFVNSVIDEDEQYDTARVLFVNVKGLKDHLDDEA